MVYKIRIPFILDIPIPPGINAIQNYGDLYYGHYGSDPNSNSDPWALTKLFMSPAPITSAPVLSLDGSDNAWIFFGTGRYNSEDDEQSTSQQYIYGIKDPFFNRNYLSSPFAPGTDYYHNTALNKTITTANILNTDNYIILSSGEISEDGSTISVNSFDYLVDNMENYDGWERKQKLTGERAIEKPAIIGGSLFVSTFLPNQDICSYGGDSYLYGLYFETGTAYTHPLFVGANGVQTVTIGGLFVSTFLPNQDICSYGGDSYLYGLYFETGTAYTHPLFVGANGVQTVTIGGTAQTKVTDVLYLGEGLASSPGIHVGKQEGNQATGFIQTSTGLIESFGIDPALNIRSGLETWRELSND